VSKAAFGSALTVDVDITLACPVRWAIINAGALQARQRRAVITSVLNPWSSTDSTIK
jgi:hypothetical protein